MVMARQRSLTSATEQQLGRRPPPDSIDRKAPLKQPFLAGNHRRRANPKRVSMHFHSPSTPRIGIFSDFAASDDRARERNGIRSPNCTCRVPGCRVEAKGCNQVAVLPDALEIAREKTRAKARAEHTQLGKEKQGALQGRVREKLWPLRDSRPECLRGKPTFSKTSWHGHSIEVALRGHLRERIDPRVRTWIHAVFRNQPCSLQASHRVL